MIATLSAVQCGRRHSFCNKCRSSRFGSDMVTSRDGDIINFPRASRRIVRSRQRCNWPSPPAPPTNLAAAAQVLSTWAAGRAASSTQILRILGCLDRAHLLELPLLPGMRINHSEPMPRILRYLFRKHVAHILHWTTRRVEGSEDGFTEEINAVIRTDIFPNDEVISVVGSCAHGS